MLDSVPAAVLGGIDAAGTMLNGPRRCRRAVLAPSPHNKKTSTAKESTQAGAQLPAFSLYPIAGPMSRENGNISDENSPNLKILPTLHNSSRLPLDK